MSEFNYLLTFMSLQTCTVGCYFFIGLSHFEVSSLSSLDTTTGHSDQKGCNKMTNTTHI